MLVRVITGNLGAILTFLSVKFTIFFTIETVPTAFSDYFDLSSIRPLNIRPASSTINSYRYSFFINSPFLWNAIPCGILQIAESKLFRSALRRFLF